MVIVIKEKVGDRLEHGVAELYMKWGVAAAPPHPISYPQFITLKTE
jgi:hypothetical protein